jgi:hypothetical protein
MCEERLLTGTLLLRKALDPDVELAEGGHPCSALAKIPGIPLIGYLSPQTAAHMMSGLKTNTICLKIPLLRDL